MTYPETLDWLAELGEFRMKLDLERLGGVLAELGSPEKKVPAVHVAGTNGKGTTTWYCEALLRAAGLTTGRFTSPHLVAPNERMAVNGVELGDEPFAALATRVRAASEAVDTPVTYFELMTAMALTHFADVGVDVAVMEVGLGGRHDATRVVEPLVTVVTAIGLDHTHILGDDVATIAAEKAQILKPGVLAVCGARDGRAITVLVDRCSEIGAPLLVIGEHFGFRKSTLAAPGVEIVDATVGMPGVHNRDNAACAAIAAWKVAALLDRPLPEEVVRPVLAELRVPGRFEWLPGTPPVLIDGAHNAGAVSCLVDVLEEKLSDGSWTLLFASMKDKNHAAVADELVRLPPPRGVVLTEIPFGDRAAAPAQLAEHLPGGWPEPQLVTPVERALAAAVQDAGETGCVVVTGSFYLAGAVRGLRGGSA